MAEDSKNNGTIFLVDDDRFLLDIYSVKFNESGFTVIANSDPQEALKRLRDGTKPDIILLDVIMPNMTGFELLETVRNENLIEDTTVIILSNQGHDDDIQKANELGADGYIIKASAIPSEVLTKTLEFVSQKKGK